MQAFQDIAKPITFKNKLIKQKYGLKCENCGRTYDYYEFENGQIFKHGCDCEMKELAKISTENYHKKVRRKKAERIFKQSIINEDLKQATFDSYEPTNTQLEYAKKLCKRYADNFDLNNKQSLLIQGSFGTGKSHLSMSIFKEVKSKGFTVLYMNVPQLISTIKNTYSYSTNMTEYELAKIVSDVDLMVFDDYGINMNEFATSKMFELIESRIGKHNIFTTNLDEKEMTKNKDLQRIFSRIMSNTTLIKMDGQDYRTRGLQL
ncbi:ATP-binding protein [Staphylococcus haemolyticus]|uniref:ATP-binding protein n=1 Tax=Staphylococcus haemolyticus TaxID=1283 RepID=UPI00051DCA70|nr:ATP-binding protein [Staphylococcus haemolyticus]KGJ25361.1 DNA replication protein DnaC [Staphylococcus haemolyticus]KGJ29253.1 DNA replication protein DnaC [Staphylococcus haemolyticus]MCH4326200.1 ATP-binding protein [Staphylococcus haemolyticus]MCH4414275.1 ATP-binding protein [Staphylococcus haemolyticus]MCH4419085.1 ATP-binding protein [Staphylococcus haemolyticus]